MPSGCHCWGRPEGIVVVNHDGSRWNAYWTWTSAAGSSMPRSLRTLLPMRREA